MAIFKCKMCGGSLEIENGVTVIECEYCGTQQTLPKLDDDRRANLYDRANHFRRNNDFDKAMGIYEQILNEDSTDAEAYWSIVLCRYGIEYVEDPATHKRVPTVNRAQYTSIFDDDNYKSALQYADSYQRMVYEEEARAINEIQKGILSISQKEDPFDVFICYKETDSAGRRTHDSVLAQELYYQLTQEGFKVFFARITLEDKLGSAYEPYIFAALNSAKVMVVLGTKPEFFSAVWVKNEWSRYLALIKNGAQKMLIPAYKDMDPYDLPEEFSHLQAQDMSKLGFMQDLVRGIKKIAQKDEPKQTTVVKETVVTSGGGSDIAPLLKRVFMFLEDGDFESADEYCEKVLDIDPENAEAYLGKLMAELKVKKRVLLKNCAEPFDGNNNYIKAVRFGEDALKAELEGYIGYIEERNETSRKERIYQKAKRKREISGSEEEFIEAATLFESIEGYKDAATLVQKCREDAENARKDAILENAKTLMVDHTAKSCEKAISLLRPLSGWKNADALIVECQKLILVIADEEKDATYERAKTMLKSAKCRADCDEAAAVFLSVRTWKDAEEQIENCRIRAEKIEADAMVLRKKLITGSAITASIVCALTIFLVVLNAVIIPNGIYNDAVALIAEGKYEEGISIIDEMNRYTMYNGIAYVGTPENPYMILVKPSDQIDTHAELHPDTKIIWDHAFYGCRSLKSITIPDGVTYIGEHAFYYCDGLKSLKIPNSITYISENTFGFCTSLTSITIPNGVTGIDDNAFRRCEGLTSITIPDSVTSIGAHAFYACEGLTSITIGSGVTSIGQGAFLSCDMLTSATFKNANGWQHAWTGHAIEADLLNPTTAANFLVKNAELSLVRK